MYLSHSANFWVNKGCNKNNIHRLSKAVLNTDRHVHDLYLLFCTINQSFSKSNCPSHTGWTFSIPLKAFYFSYTPFLLRCFFSYHLKQNSVTWYTVFFFFVTIRLQPREHITHWRLKQGSLSREALSTKNHNLYAKALVSLPKFRALYLRDMKKIKNLVWNKGVLKCGNIPTKKLMNHWTHQWTEPIVTYFQFHYTNT